MNWWMNSVRYTVAFGAALLSLALLLGGCPEPGRPVPNQSPVADAGADLTVDEGQRVILDGSASRDPDGDSLTYSWEQVSGPNVELSDIRAARTSFTAPKVTKDTELRFRLSVSDGRGGSDSDDVRVLVRDTNMPPTANAGEDHVIALSASADLDGSLSTDPEGEALTFEWSQKSGPATVEIDNASSARATATPPKPGEYVFTLVVTDAGGLSSSDDVRVLVAPPFADNEVVNVRAGVLIPKESEIGTVTLPDSTNAEAVLNELLISCRLDLSEEEADEILGEIAALGGRVVGQIPELRVLQVRFDPSTDLNQARAQLVGLEGVLSANYNLSIVSDRHRQTNQEGFAAYEVRGPAATGWRRPVFAEGVSTARAIGRSPFDYKPSGFEGDYWIDQIDAETAWSITQGSWEIPLAVVDIGFTPLEDWDVRGLLDASRITRVDVLGNDLWLPFTTGSLFVPDEHHGWAVTAFAAGDGDPATREDSVGVAWKCPIIQVQLDTIYLVSGAVADYIFDVPRVTSSMYAGIVQAVLQGARVINVSMGQNTLSEKREMREALSPAVELCARRDVLFIKASGNEGFLNDDQLLPLGSDQPESAWTTNAIIVGATDEDALSGDASVTPMDRVAWFSNLGEVVDLVAPGDNVSADPRYTLEISGTSFAAPIVAGAAALCASANPALTAAELKQLLIDTANHVPFEAPPEHPEWEEPKVGAGLLNAGAAVQAALATRKVPVGEPIVLELDPGERITREIEYTLPGATAVRLLDVLFLIDTSGSYWDDIATLKQAANTIVTTLSGLAEDVQFGVASFADFPLGRWGDPGDAAFVLDQPITDDVDAVFHAIDMLDQPLNSGDDTPESQLEALFQTATGAGRDINGDGDFSDLGEIQPMDVGWRSGALRVIILATDAPFHDSVEEPSYPGPTFDETIAALNAAGIVVNGLDSGDTEGDLQRVANATGGAKFDLTSNSEGIAEAIFAALEFNLTHVNLTLEPIGDFMGFISVSPADGYPDVKPGESRTFTVTFEGVTKRSIGSIHFRNIRLWIRAHGSGLLKRIPVEITIPGWFPGL